MKHKGLLKKVSLSSFLIIFACASSLYAQEDSSERTMSQSRTSYSDTQKKDYFADPAYSRLSELLTGWLSNDLLLKKAVLDSKSKELSLNSAEISNGIDLELSSGYVSVTTDTSGATSISVNPSLSLSVPAANGAQIDFELPYTVSDGKKTVSGGSLSATAGIVSSVSKQRKITLLEAERAVLEAQRAVRDRALKAEKEFYENLKKLYNYAVSIHSLKTDLYEDELELKVLETKGYSKTSASYRQAALKVESDRRSVQEKQRLIERETAVFALKCGLEFTRVSDEYESRSDRVKAGEEAYKAVLAFLPDTIPYVTPERIFDYKKEDYSGVESASWEQYIGQLKREADYDMTLTATGEYKFNSSASGYDDAGGKLNFNWKGLTASAGAYVPTGRNTFETRSNAPANDNPYFQFSVSIDPNEWRLSKIEKEQDKITVQKEEIAVKSAVDDWESAVLEKMSTIHDIRWSRSSCAEEYDMYMTLEKDMAKWLEQGIVTENDYLDALNNKEKARISVILNAIDLLIFNDEVKLLFYNEQ